MGISAAIFNEHYNQPLLEDRLAKREILPGSGWKPRTPEELAGQALLDFTSGRLSKDEFEAHVARAKELRSQPHVRAQKDVGYQ